MITRKNIYQDKEVVVLIVHNNSFVHFSPFTVVVEIIIQYFKYHDKRVRSLKIESLEEKTARIQKKMRFMMIRDAICVCLLGVLIGILFRIVE